MPETCIPAPYLTRGEAATYLRVSLSTIARWVRDGVIPHHKFGGVVRIPLSAITTPATTITTITTTEG